MITFTHRGDFGKTEKFLNGVKKIQFREILNRYGGEGVAALRSATPKDSGLTAESWDYEVVIRRSGFSIFWTNSNLNEGVPIAILIQYGHGTRSGSFVEGRDFINPAIKPTFDKIAENLWKEVTSL